MCDSGRLIRSTLCKEHIYMAININESWLGSNLLSCPTLYGSKECCKGLDGVLNHFVTTIDNALEQAATYLEPIRNTGALISVSVSSIHSTLSQEKNIFMTVQNWETVKAWTKNNRRLTEAAQVLEAIEHTDRVCNAVSRGTQKSAVELESLRVIVAEIHRLLVSVQHYLLMVREAIAHISHVVCQLSFHWGLDVPMLFLIL